MKKISKPITHSWLIRQGFLPEGENSEINTRWISDAVDQLEKETADLNRIKEKDWIEALENTSRHICRDPRVPGKESLIDPRNEELPLVQIDSYIRGIVRWLNMLGIHTAYSCDGEGRGRAYVYLLDELTAKQATLIQACATDKVKVRFNQRRVDFHYPLGKPEVLLDVAERLYHVWKDEDALNTYRIEHLKKRLIPLLTINGKSGRESRIRQYVKQKLKSKTDWLTVDHYGNLLARKDCGQGPVVLLSAHLDTVMPYPPRRRIIENGTILKSSEGILGADDRAGIAVILELLDFIPRSRFQGTVKVAFTVEEEIGCMGSKHIRPDFLSNVDVAIVVDRKGTRDIVTSYADRVTFCPREYGRIFERAGVLSGMPDWKMTPGGMSDALVFAQLGIPSVNLSVGYHHPHTDWETLDVSATLDTIRLLETVFDEQTIRAVIPTF